MTFAKIYMGNSLIHSINAKKIETSIDNNFIRITDSQDNTIEVSPHNVIIINQKKGSERYGYESPFDRQGSI